MPLVLLSKLRDSGLEIVLGEMLGNNSILYRAYVTVWKLGQK